VRPITQRKGRTQRVCVAGWQQAARSYAQLAVWRWDGRVHSCCHSVTVAVQLQPSERSSFRLQRSQAGSNECGPRPVASFFCALALAAGKQGQAATPLLCTLHGAAAAPRVLGWSRDVCLLHHAYRWRFKPDSKTGSYQTRVNTNSL